MGFGPCSGDELGTEDRICEHTHTHRPSSISIPLSQLFMYLSFRFTAWLYFIISTIICALTAFDREKDGRREEERDRRGRCYITFLN